MDQQHPTSIDTDAADVALSAQAAAFAQLLGRSPDDLGGGALSGKDLSDIDRAGAYAARHAALRAVRTGASECRVVVAYAGTYAGRNSDRRPIGGKEIDGHPLEHCLPARGGSSICDMSHRW